MSVCFSDLVTAGAVLASLPEPECTNRGVRAASNPLPGISRMTARSSAAPTWHWPKSGDTEDIANTRIRFRGGCVANITASRISEERLRKIRVFQGDAYLSLDYANQTGEIHRAAKVGPLIVGIKKEDVKIEKDEPLKRELASFAACAAAGHQPKVSGQEGAAALNIAMIITELIESGEARREFPVSPTS